MFGGHEDTQGAQNGVVAAPQDDTLSGVTELVGGTAIPGPGDAGYQPPMPMPQPPAQNDVFMSPPTPPAMPAPSDDIPTPAPMPEPAVNTPATDPMPLSPVPPAAPADDDDLMQIKQQALQQLSPLVGQLDQSPEEKFRTTMMLIQAADNRELLKEAYEAAQNISDDKERAQALLDVINEINYFTQPKQAE